MGEPESKQLCPSCHTVFPVEPDWRMAQCPHCGGMITRMSEDSAYD
jgi:predicted RNA-binding Zn-ribbon protein involved in translation (DUF1610 family)